MHNLILYVAFLSAVAGYQNGPSNYKVTQTVSPLLPQSSPSSTLSSLLSTASTATEKFDVITTTQQNIPSASSSSKMNKNNKNVATETTTVNLLNEILSEFPNSSPSATEGDSKRRYITYDQRQEGQYNIRADLENFMIVLIPPSPADGINLLDLLTKASYRRNTHASSKNKKREKHYMSSTAIQPEGIKLQNTLKSGGIHHINFLKPVDGDNLSIGSSAGEYIEGRTPYQVDISSTANDDVTSQSRLQNDRQVDVLPPPYPLAYQQLIKPYHLEAESTLIQTLPPTELVQTKKQSTDTTNNLNSAGNYFRLARAIRGDTSFLDTNRVTPLNSVTSVLPSIYSDRFLMNRRTHTLPIYRADLSLGAAQLYPPLDIPHYSSYITLNARNREEELKHLKNDDADASDTNDRQSLNSDLNSDDILDDDFELHLHNNDGDNGGSSVTFIDPDAKTLLSDGIERCAPGKRRDSYGVCRQIGDGY